MVLYTDLADYYDLIIDKDTEKEVDFLEAQLEECETVLDLACGNGRHSCRLQQRGLEVTGVERSEELLRKARKKCDADFVNGDITSLSLSTKFDAAILMWSTVNLFEKNEIKQIFRQVAEVLNEGGVFILDSKRYPGDKKKQKKSEKVENEEVVIEIESEHEYSNRKRVSSYNYTVRDKESGTMEEYDDSAEVRYYTEEEFRKLLKDAGFEVEKVFNDYGEDGKGERMIFRCGK